MKKLFLAFLGLLAGTAFAYAQGSVSLQANANGTVVTNGASLGIGYGTGSAIGGPANFNFELLDMTAPTYNALSSPQKSAIGNLLANPSSISLWTDSGISGFPGQGLSAGEVDGEGGGGGTTAANWGAPTGPNFSGAPIDYYTIVGWSANEGASWLSISNSVATGNWTDVGPGAWFGQTIVAYNAAGGGPDSLPVVNLWANSADTGIAGSGINISNPELTLLPIVPEPTTLALAGLGGLSLFFFGRRKA